MDDADHFLLKLPSLLPNLTYISMLNRKLWKTLFSIIFSNNKFLCQINLISSLSSSTSNSSIVELLQLSIFCSFDIFFLYPLFYENTMCTSSLMCAVHWCFTLALQSLFLSFFGWGKDSLLFPWFWGCLLLLCLGFVSCWHFATADCWMQWLELFSILTEHKHDILKTLLSYATCPSPHFKRDVSSLGTVRHTEDCLTFSRLKFTFSKKATKIDKIFTVDLTFTNYIASNRLWRFHQFLWPSRKHKL